MSVVWVQPVSPPRVVAKYGVDASTCLTRCSGDTPPDSYDAAEVMWQSATACQISEFASGVAGLGSGEVYSPPPPSPNSC